MRRLLLLFVLSAAILAAFQWTNEKKEKPRDPNFRNVHGLVTLPDGNPAESAVVELKDMKTKVVKSFITQTNGKYMFTHISTKVDYEITAHYKKLVSPRRQLTIYDTRIDPVMNLRLDEPGAAKAEEEKD